MFNKDYWNNPEPLSIYLARPTGEIISNIDDCIDESSTSLTIGVNQQFELSFQIRMPANDNAIADYIQEGMYLLVDKVGLFKMIQPSSTYDGATDLKSITAYSCDSELEDKNCTLQINIGLETSMEYLVEYDDDETELLVNPYTNIPYDWILLYNTFPEQLEILLSLYNAGHFGSQSQQGDTEITNSTLIEEINSYLTTIPRLKNKLIPDNNGDYTLEEYAIISTDDNDGSITKITLTNEFDDRIEDLITFYTKYRSQLSLLDVVLENTGWSVGNIYGLSDSDYSLSNTKYQFEIDSTIYAFLTQDLAQSIGCVVNFDILNRKVNVIPVEYIGDNTGIIMEYDTLVNSLNINSNDERLSTRLYVTGGNGLGIEQVNFGLEWVDDITYKLNAKDSSGKRIYVSDALAEKYANYITFKESKRDEYVQLSKDYRNIAKQISEIQYRVPNDDLKTDWGTFSLDELEAMLTTYNNLLVSLITLYKEDYTPAGINQDGSVNENYLKNTMYWYDYEAYKNILDEIECAIDVFPNYNNQDQWTQQEKDTYLDLINAWETDWSLYGTIELQAKIDTYKANMDILIENGSVIVNSNGAAIPWSNLTSAQKAQYGNSSSVYFYDTYTDYRNLYLSANSYLAILKTQLEGLQTDLDETESERLIIVNAVKQENYFTADECEVIYRLFKDADYSNENILFTNINTSDEELDAAYELLEDAQNQAFISGRPQLTFSIDADNLLGLSEFSAFWSSFVPGNYMLIQYKDDIYLKLRMVSYEFNPLLPSQTNMTINFSNFIRSKAGVSDIESVLGLNSGGISGRSGGGLSGGSGGGYGESDDIDVTISNTMLSKLLNSELFGTRVTNVILDTVDANSINAKSATFGGLSSGQTTIDGACIKTGSIQSNNYSSTNHTGSILRLDDGTFSFGGGKLTYENGTLSVDGTVYANNGNIGDFTLSNGKLYTNNHSAYNSNVNGVYIGSDYISLGRNGAAWIKNDGTFSFGGGRLTYDGTTLSLNGTISATAGSIGDFTIGNGKLYTNNHSAYNSNVQGVYIGSDYISLGSGGVSWLKNDGTFRLGGSNGISYSGNQITIGSNVTMSGGTITGSTITGSNITTNTFRANGSSNESYCTIGDTLYMQHKDVGTGLRFIRLQELEDVISGTNIWSYVNVYGNQIEFGQTSNGTASIYYSGSGELQVAGSVSMDGSIALANSYTNLIGNISCGRLSDLNDAMETNFYSFASGASHTPIDAGGVLMVACYTYSNDNMAIHQMAFMNHNGNNNPQIYCRYRYTGNNLGWGDWNRLI